LIKTREKTLSKLLLLNLKKRVNLYNKWIKFR